MVRYIITAIYKSGRTERHHAKSDVHKAQILKALSKIPTIEYVNEKEMK